MRPYDHLAETLADTVDPTAPAAVRQQMVVDLGWTHLAPHGVSWIGFYAKVVERDEMVLGARRDKPACSPIGLHGACGQAWRQQAPLLVRDVRDLGAGYIACDPRDQSEVVVPFFDGAPTPCGVLDLDSHEVAAFDEADVAGLIRVLHAAGLHPGQETG